MTSQQLLFPGCFFSPWSVQTAERAVLSETFTVWYNDVRHSNKKSREVSFILSFVFTLTDTAFTEEVTTIP